MITNVDFSVSKLLDPTNRAIAEKFNADSLVYESGLFSFENTYNHVNLGVMFASNPEEGIWDAVCRIDLERNLFVVTGNEGCSGFGVMVTAYFNAKGLLVDYSITGESMNEELEKNIRTLTVEVFMVEPMHEEAEKQIRETYANVIE